MFNKKTIKDVDLRGKVVLLRADYNVPIEYDSVGNTQILNDFRIRASLPTLNFLRKNGVRKIIIISHLGRPESVETLADLNELEKLKNGKRKFSLKPIFDRLQELLFDNSKNINRFDMKFHATPIFSHTRYSQSIGQTDNDCKIEMLENLRFCTDEKKNSSELAEALLQVTGADLFVQDGFGVIHRAHTSTDAITKMIQSVAGLLVEKEISTITKSLNNPPRPLTVVMGGAKISDKLPLIEKFIDCADNIILGGAMANTFLKYHGFEIGKSKIEVGQEEIIKDIENMAFKKFGEDFRNHFILPTDFGVADEFLKNVSRRSCRLGEISKNDMILDIGEEYVNHCRSIIKNSKTIIWNGTMGVNEFDNFGYGSNKIAESISLATKNDAISIIGGGDTSAFVIDFSEKNPDLASFSLISTGGGATLELMSGQILPGLEALQNK